MVSTSRVLRADSRADELLGEHRSGKPLEEFSRWADDPVGFDIANGREPVDYQRRIMESVVSNKLTVVRGCHAAGKEFVAGSVAVWAAYCRRMLVIIVSATERQVLHQTLREVRAAWRACPDLPGQLFQGSVRIGGEDRIVALTGGSSIDALTGWHDPAGVLVVISEGQGERLEDSAYDAAFAVATDDRSRVLVLGNPVRPTGRFFQINQAPHWNQIHVSAFDTPNIRAGRMVRAGFPSPEWPDEIAREYGGTSSPFYVSRVLAEFPDTGEESLFSRSWLDRAAERWQEGAWAKEAQCEPVLGLDPARYGADATVLAVRRGPRLEELVEWRGHDTVQTVMRCEDEFRRVRMRQKRVTPLEGPAWGTVVVDVVGLGAGIHDQLRANRWKVKAYNGGAFSAESQKRFLNLRARSFWHLRTLLEEDRIALPPDDRLHEELLALRWFPTTDGRVQLERKEDLKSRLGRSPDRADAVVMAFSLSMVRRTVKTFAWRV